MAKTTILGIKLTQRTASAPLFQQIVTKYGCNIKTRIGLHNVTDNKCSADGIIVLEAIGNEDEVNSLESELKAISGADVQKMVFETE